MRFVRQSLLLVVILVGLSVPAYAGPIVIDGTDANDHGFVSGGVNLDGWEYMQRALQELAAELLAGNATAPKTVLSLGLSGSQAGAAFTSAFNLSTLPGAGWSTSNVDGAAAIATALGTLSATTTGILYLPTAGLSAGDLDATELAAINANAAQIAAFVNAGGALFAMGETGVNAFGWLSAMIPGLVFTDVGGGGIGTNIVLTAAGTAAFPGLTNTDLAGADPWHGYFSGNLGSLQVLATAPDSSGVNRNLIIGGGIGTQITASPVPEPASLLLLGSGVAGLLARRRRNKAETA